MNPSGQASGPFGGASVFSAATGASKRPTCANNCLVGQTEITTHYCVCCRVRQTYAGRCAACEQRLQLEKDRAEEQRRQREAAAAKAKADAEAARRALQHARDNPSEYGADQTVARVHRSQSQR